MRIIGLLTLAALVAAALWYGGLGSWLDGGRYPRLDHDHAEPMVSDTPHAQKTLTILFIGNSLTFHSDIPATLVNIASSDPGDTVRLQVNAVTAPDARLADANLRERAIPWVQAHQTDFAILKEHGQWYDRASAYDVLGVAYGWANALRSQGVTPLLFEDYADGEGSRVYTEPDWPTSGSNPTEDAARSANATAGVARALNLEVVPVGEAFELARKMPGAPDLWESDRHHPSAAGAYLAALVFYRRFTGRTGAEARWRPFGLSRQGAQVLVQAASEAG